MKRLLLATAVGLLSLSSAVAFAAPDHEHGNGNGHGDDRGRSDQQRGDDNRNQGDGHRGNDHHGDRNDSRNDNAQRWSGDQDRREQDRRQRDDHGYRNGNGHWAHHDNGRHLGQFRRGERVPAMYRQQRYYVTDYRAYNLAAPPRGYRWVQPDNGRYLLISTATGLISQMLGY